MTHTIRIVVSVLCLIIGLQYWYTPRPSATLTSYLLRSQTPEHPADYVLLGYPIDLNRADPALLEILPGIGPALGQRIVADRRQRGFFASVDELTRVRGIGPQLLQRIRDAEMLTIRP